MRCADMMAVAATTAFCTLIVTQTYADTPERVFWSAFAMVMVCIISRSGAILANAAIDAVAAKLRLHP